MKIVNMLKTCIVTAGTALVISSPANAGSVTVAGAEVLRTGCSTQNSGCFIVVASPANPASCTGNGLLISFDATTPAGKNSLATALTIKAAGFTANLTLDDTVCNGPNPRLLAITAN